MAKKEGNNAKSLDYAWKILKKIVGLLVFLLIMYFINAFSPYITNVYFFEALSFVNSNLVLIVIISVFFIIAEIFDMMIFPYNLPSPLFMGAASLFLVSLILSSLKFLDYLLSAQTFVFLNDISFFVYLLVFLLVMFSSYVSIFYTLVRRDYSPEGEETKIATPGRTWGDVGNEFRFLLYDVFHDWRKKVEKSKKK